MARLREADLQAGDRLRYIVGKGPAATRIPGRIEKIERGEGTPAIALFTRDDTGDQIIIRLGHLARHSTRLRVAV